MGKHIYFVKCYEYEQSRIAWLEFEKFIPILTTLLEIFMESISVNLQKSLHKEDQSDQLVQ